MTVRISLNRGWEFTESFDEAFLCGEGPAKPAELPHTCRETPYHYFDESEYQMVCGYRRRISVPEQWRGRRVFLCVGAAGHSAEVYVDGKLLAEHRCGYTAFRTELTDALTPGTEALLVLRVDSRESQDIPPFGNVVDYMTFGGLYREVWLDIRGPVFIEDVFAKPEADPDRRTGRVASEIALAGAVEGAVFALRQTVMPAGTSRIAAQGEVPVTGGKAELTLDCGAVNLWDTENPALYCLKTELLRDGDVIDETVTRIGFREAVFRADGFYLNGRKTKLIGLNRHQSWPYIGYAAPKSLQRFDAEILKYELGVNAVRTSHYPQSQHFIDRCDELGLLVFTEIPGWQHVGGEEWKRQAVRNTEEMILQYRNHPSIILWGVRINESVDDDALYAETNAVARRLDPTRQTGGVRYLKKSRFLEDVYTYNDFLHDGNNPGCEMKKNVTPDVTRAYLISEFGGHMYPTKSFDSEEHRLSHALRHAAVLDAAAAQEDVAGAFGWCMFDYNTHSDFGSGDRICYHGVMDMFRNPKIAADVYSVGQDDVPVLSVSSSMDIGEHPAGNRGRVFLFTNAEAVRMYRNGVFVREYTHADSPFRHLRRPPVEITDYIGSQIEDNEPFTQRQAALTKEIINYTARFGSARLPLGILLKAGWLMLRYRMSFADAYQLYGKYIGDWGAAAKSYRFEAIKDGEVVKTVVRSPVVRVALAAAADHTALREEDSYAAALVRIRMIDQEGNCLPFYGGAVRLAAEGPIRVVGPETATLRGGMGGTIVATTGRSGAAALTLTPEQGDPVRIEFTVEAEEKSI